MEFEFNKKGEIVTVYTPGRFREVKGRFELTPWKGTFSKYINVGGYLIPSEARVEWILKSKIYSYFKTKIVDVSYK